MLKKILKYSALALVVCYIIFALLIIPGKDDAELCNELIVNIDENNDMLSGTDVLTMLQDEGLDPRGKPLGEIKCFEIEHFMNSISLISSCQTYKTVNGNIVLEIDCRRPILAVIGKDGEQFCIDKDGAIIEGIPSMLYLPLATGNITDSMATAELKLIAEAIDNDRFWKAQTEQIYFDENRNIILVPRVGNHIIELGTADSIATKLENVKAFYGKGLNIVGWNKYSKLNAEYENRVICTKRNEN
ncbi:MAG: cell division protein FtsQ [Bacteroidaceae bacterium]|nr:cell division protein FtsQ [Bacteroidaceae bacterium]